MYRLFYIVSLIVIVIDQWSKYAIVKKMELYETTTVIKNFFWITSHRNKGAAWGILQDQMIFFYIITVIVLAALIYYIEKYVKQTYPLLLIGLTLIIGGAIGNFIDRLFRKEVVDFLDFNLFGYNYPIFNIADAALVIGVGIVLLATLFEERWKRSEVA